VPLPAKLTPADTTRALRRQRLHAQLSASGARGLWLLGGAGSGKSTLAAMWAAEQAAPLHWFRIDAADADWPTALAALGNLAATRRRRPPPLLAHRPAVEALREPQLTGHLQRVLRALHAHLGSTVLVFDDAHAAPTLEPLLEAALTEAPAGTTVVVTSREPPGEAHLDSLLRGHWQVLDNSALAFTADEALAWLTPALGRERAAQVAARAGGWAAALGWLAQQPRETQLRRQLQRQLSPGEHALLAACALLGDVSEADLAALGGFQLQADWAQVAQAQAGTTLNADVSASRPVLAANAAGAAWAFWVATTPNGAHLQASALQAGEWGPPQPLAAMPGYLDAVGLQAGMDAAGNVLVSWDAGNGPVVLRHDAASATWAAPLALGGGACPGGLAQRLAVAPGGEAALLWQRSGANPGVCLRSGTGAGWQAAQPVDAALGATAVPLALAVRSGGDALAGWTAALPQGGLYTVRATAGTWGSPVAGPTGASAVALALAEDGSAVLAWRGDDPLFGGNIFAAPARPGQDWRAATRLGTVNSGSNLHAAWAGAQRFAVGYNSFNSGPQVATVDAATQQWSAAQTMAAGRLALLGTLAADAQGHQLATWLGNKPSGFGLDLGLSVRADGSLPWDDGLPILTPQPTSALDATDQARLSSAAVSNGLATLVWLDWGPADPGEQPTLRVRASRFRVAP